MMRIVGGVLVVLLALPAFGDEDKAKDKKTSKDGPTPAAQYRALVKEYNDGMQAFMKEYRAAKTQQERQKLFQEKYPRPDKFVPKFLALAEQHPKDPAAVEAAEWVLSNSYGAPGDKNSPHARALALLRREHLQSDKLGTACQSLAYGADPASEAFLRDVLDKNPHKNVQGVACLALAQLLKQRGSAMQGQAKDGEKLRKESVQLFERAAKEYADVKLPYGSTVGARASGELFEMRHLQIGKKAPDIEGEDSDGKKFKLSDYRGKVVMLDFWGNW